MMNRDRSKINKKLMEVPRELPGQVFQNKLIGHVTTIHGQFYSHYPLLYRIISLIIYYLCNYKLGVMSDLSEANYAGT